MALSCVLGVLIIATPPLAFVGSVILTGAGHGTTMFYDMYYTPKALGFFLPSIAAALVTLPRWKLLTAIGLVASAVTLMIEAGFLVFGEWYYSHAANVASSLPYLTYSVAVVGPLTCLLSILLAIWRLNRQREEVHVAKVQAVSASSARPEDCLSRLSVA